MRVTPREARRLYGRFDARRLPCSVISVCQALELFRKLRPDQEVYLLSLCEAREVAKKGTPAPYNDCCVVSRSKVVLNLGYEDAVNDRRRAEKKKSDFKAKDRPWGVHIGLPFVHHVVDGQHRLYLSLFKTKTLGREYHTWDLRPLSFDKIKRYLKPPRKDTRQGLDRPVQYRNYLIESVLAVGLVGPRGGEKLFVIDAATAKPSKLAKKEAVKAGIIKGGSSTRKKSTRGAR